MTVDDRAYGALLGLALGDAVGMPALYHRTLALPPRRRARLWQFSADVGRERVLRLALPYVQSQPEELLDLCGTDDTEFAAVAVRILLECGDEVTLDRLFDGWRRHVVDHADVIWSGISERASVVNAQAGLAPPATGSDNPQFYDDGAVARAVPVGIRYRGRPQQAAEVAGLLASITNAADGIVAAQAMAASVAVAVDTGDAAAAVAAGLAVIPKDSWLGRDVARALAVLDRAGSGFAAVPGWTSQVVTRVYNYGNAAPETLAVAYAIARATGGDLVQGVQLGALIPKQSDSMPAMVGALAGAAHGTSAVPPEWVEALDTLRGLCLPELVGTSLRDLAAQLLA